jgi:hypothetical protein
MDGSGYRFRLETTEEPADPPTLSVAVPDWPDGSLIYLASGPRICLASGARAGVGVVRVLRAEGRDVVPP